MKVLIHSDLKLKKGIGYSREHIRRKERGGTFPMHINLGEGRIGWIEDEIDAWLAELAANRPPGAPESETSSVGSQPTVPPPMPQAHLTGQSKPRKQSAVIDSDEARQLLAGLPTAEQLLPDFDYQSVTKPLLAGPEVASLHWAEDHPSLIIDNQRQRWRGRPMTDLSEVLEAESKRLLRKRETVEQSERERAARAWWKNLRGLWTDAYLLSDEELEWLATVTDATRDKPARVSRNPWTGGRTVMWTPTSWNDAIRAEELRRELWQRESKEERRLRREARLRLAKRLARLGLQADRYAEFDTWAALDSYWDELEEGAP